MKKIDMALEKILTELLSAGKTSTLSDVLLTMNPADAAVFLNSVEDSELAEVFDCFSAKDAALLFVELDDGCWKALLSGMDVKKMRDMLDQLFIDDLITLIKELDDQNADRIRNLLSAEKAGQVETMLSYPEDSIGALMNTAFVALRPEMSVSAAISHIRVAGLGKETVNTCYVVDRCRHLTGAVMLRTLVTTPDDQVEVRNVMEVQPVSVQVKDDKEAVSHCFSKYDLTMIPVVDEQNHLLGIVTVDDVIDVIQTEATEDMQKMAAIIPSETPYLNTPVLKVWLSRVPWLMILMVGATFTAKVITSFESALSACLVLTAYIPMLMDTAGNAGSQASVTVVRSLALGELCFRDYFRVIWKELRVSVLCGVALVVCNFAKLMLLDRVGAVMAATICLALFISVIFSKLIGASLPLLIGKLGFDPAVMAGPILTTVVDALTLLVYFSVASQVLGLV